MVRGFITFSGFTFVSRILGFIRDFLMAYYLGAGFLSDVFFAAFRIPNVFRSILSEGSLSSVFVPIYKKVKIDKNYNSSNFLNLIFTVLFFVSFLICFILQLYMPWFIQLFTPGFSSDFLKKAEVVLLARIMMPYLIFICLSSFFSSVLQSFNKFASFAFYPIILNIVLIADILWFNVFFDKITTSLSFSVVISGFIQFLWMLFSVYKYGIRLNFTKIKFDFYTVEFFKRIVPSIIGSSMSVFSVFISTFFASFYYGGVSFFYYAERLIQFPLAIIGISLNVVSLPLISDKVNNNDMEGLFFIQNKAIKIALLISIPAATALAVIPDTIVKCVFMYGGFGIHAFEGTRDVLQILAFALPPMVCHKIFVSTFFAFGDVKTPMKISLFCSLLNIILNVLLHEDYGYVCIAFSTVSSVWLEFVIVVFVLKKRNFYKFDVDLRFDLAKIFFYMIPMLLSVCVIDYVLADFINSSSVILKLSAVSIISLLGCFVYFGFSYICNKIFWK